MKATDPQDAIDLELQLGTGPEFDDFTSRIGETECLATGVTLELLLSSLRYLNDPPGSISHFSHVSGVPRSRRSALIRIDPLTQDVVLLSRSCEASDDTPSQVHVIARAAASPAMALSRGEHRPAEGALAVVSRQRFYAALASWGHHPASWLRVITRVAVGRDTATGELLPALGRSEPGFCTDPSLLDAAFQLTQYLACTRDEAAAQFVSVGQLSVLRTHQARRLLLHACSEASHDACWHACFEDGVGTPTLRILHIRYASSADQRAHSARVLGARILERVRQAVAMPDLRADESLLARGASSLDLVRIQATLSEHWGWVPPLSTLLAAPSADSIAQCYLAPYAEHNARVPQAPHEHTSRASALSYTEQRFWFLETHARVGHAYNEAIAWTLEGRLDASALQAAVEWVVRRHEALSTVFPQHERRPVRTRRQARRDVWRLVDLGPGATLEDLQREATAETQRDFDLARGPLLRATLFRLGATRHALLLSAHHIVVDEWSVTEIIAAEIAGCYAALRAGEQPPSQPAAPDMSSYVAWEQSTRGPAHVSRRVQDWAAQLRGYPTVLELPSDRPRAALQSHRGRRMIFDCDVAVSQSVRQLARQLDVTPFAVLLSAFAMLIHRCTEQDRFLIAVPVSVRSPELARTVGCLVNTLVIPAEVSEGHSAADLVRATFSTLTRALAYQHVPFDELVAALGGARDLGSTPLTQVAFSYHQQSAHAFQLPGLRVEDLRLDISTSKFDLMFEVFDRGGPLRLVSESSSDLYDVERIEQIAHQYMLLLAAMTARPDLVLPRSWAFDEAESARLSRFERGPRVGYPFDDIPSMIDAGAQHGSDACAVVCSGRRYTYARLTADVTALSQRLAHCLDGDETLVALCTGRSYRWIVAMLALLRVGRGYLPLDPRTPPARARAILERTEVRTLLYTDDVCTWSTAFGGRRLDLNCEPESTGAPPGAAPHAPPSMASGDALAYAITTSGTTGVPKTAGVLRRSFANLVQWYAEALELGPQSRILIATSVAFDLTQKNVFAGLARGACLVLRDEAEFDPHALLDAIAREQVSVINCTPSLCYALVDACADREHSQLRSLRDVVLGGEPIALARLRPWLDHSSTRVTNSYGPTECTDVCSATRPALIGPTNLSLPIGRALPNVELRVLDAHGERVPLGTPGELHVLGEGLGRGYLDDPQATAAAFVCGPRGELMYRTGDVVRYDWQGNLWFIGRRDQQVKVRGHRIELGEVESALREHPRLTAAAVKACTERDGETTLAAYYISDAELDPLALRRGLAERVPTYMLPASFTRLASLPLTTSGKIDRNALPQPVPPAVPPPGPEDSRQARLRRAWGTILETTTPDLDDDFFEAGGHSLRAVQLAQAASEIWLTRCRIADVFRQPTIRALAAFLDAGGHSKPEA